MKYLNMILICVILLALSSCGITKKTLGLSKEGPDENLVQTNQPLVLPPEYNVRPKVNSKDDDNSSYFQDDEE